MKRFIDKPELFMKKMRWKTLSFLNPNTKSTERETYGFGTSKSLPVIEELKEFEDSKVNLIQSIELENKNSKLQNTIREDLKKVTNAAKLTIKAAKTTNYYKIESQKC